ncbi:alpha/beta hydrolase [soil metagenome]
MKRLLKVAAALLAVGYVGIGIFLYLMQNALIFCPTRLPFGKMEALAKEKGFVPWTNGKGERIGWQSVEGNPNEVLLAFNGQGGYALKLGFLRECCQSTPGNWKTYLLEYPGYGSREGIPTEASLTAAGVEAVDTLAAEPGRKIWLAGQSLGSGTACATVRERGGKISGLLLLTPFNSLVAASSGRYPWLPVSALLRTRFESDKNLSNYPGPVAVFVSGKDTTIPCELGKKLYEGYPGRKRLWIDPESNHDVSGLLLRDWGKVVEWLENPSQ